jgi:CopG family nickel-responsive transcriptional regulator
MSSEDCHMTKERVMRFGVSVPHDLLREFDVRIAQMGYDRSKAIQVAMRNFLTEYALKNEEKGTIVGTMTIIYDHGIKGLEERLTDIQHHYRGIIGSAMHIHLDDRNCLLTVAVNGELRSIQDIAKELMVRRGIKQLKLTTVMS